MLHTPRLHLRPLTEADFPHIYRLQSDPEVMRYIRAASSEEAPIRERMAAWADYALQNPGLGVWGMFLKEDGAFVGYATGRHVDFDAASGEYEVGYTLAPEHWGKGLATEVAQGVCRYLFDVIGAPEILAFTDPENHPSQQVLRKCGFVEAGRRVLYGGELLVFRLGVDMGKPSSVLPNLISV